MTAEIAVMNKIAVALAADSAATSQHGTNTKIYNTADKLFQLDGASPVGIMTYGAAELMGIPWETVIKLYRKNHRGPHDYLKKYGEDFLRFLACPELLSDDHIGDCFIATVKNVFTGLRGEASRRAMQKGASDGADFASTIEKLTSEVVSDLMTAPKMSWSNDQAEHELIATFDEKLEAAIADAFKGETVGITALQNLKKIAWLVTQAKPQIGEMNVAGLAIAGFGEAQLFPEAWSCAIRGIAPGRRLQVQDLPLGDVGLHCPARIIPFAQAEMVHSFMRGIDPDVQGMVFGSFQSLLQKLVSHMSAQLGGMPPEQITKFTTEADGMVAKLIKAFRQEFDNNSVNNYVSPVLGAVGVLPKDELAVMAETLVALTSFKRRMSRDAETVGGAIDVAVISKGDGFVWIKRKHYFDPSLNVRYINKLSKHGEAPIQETT